MWFISNFTVAIPCRNVQWKSRLESKYWLENLFFLNRYYLSFSSVWTLHYVVLPSFFRAKSLLFFHTLEIVDLLLDESRVDFSSLSASVEPSTNYYGNEPIVDTLFRFLLEWPHNCLHDTSTVQNIFFDTFQLVQRDIYLFSDHVLNNFPFPEIGMKNNYSWELNVGSHDHFSSELLFLHQSPLTERHMTYFGDKRNAL